MDISVVMATYNGEKYVKQQLDSVINQTRKPDELIIVDDGSKDNTVKIINKVLQDTKIKYKLIIHAKNQGVTRTFQEAITQASSEYIMICDQDDVWKANKIEQTIGAIKKDITMVVCDATLVDADLKPIGKSMFQYIGLPLALNDYYTTLYSKQMMLMSLKRNYVTGMCMAGKRSVILKAFPFPETMTYDAWLAWNLANEGQTVFINEELVFYRQHDRNVVGTRKNKESLRKYYGHRRDDKKRLVEKYKSLTKVKIADAEVKSELEEAVEFYEERFNLNSVSRIQALYNLYNSVKKDRYEKYTGIKNKEIEKDLMEILFFK